MTVTQFCEYTKNYWIIHFKGINIIISKFYRNFPGGPVAKTLCLPMQGIQVQLLVGKLDPTCYKEFACRNEDRRSHVHN